MTEFITLRETIAATPERLYDAFLTPEDLLQWHRASEDWTTPHAMSDPVVGGKFNIGFGDPNGEYSFDFTGTYSALDHPTHIAYTIDDGRLVTIDFEDAGDGQTHVVWKFEPENTFPKEMQEQGWMAQLVNLKRYLEG
ncbi:MAG: SRPBCC domain-containing protein [Thermomicrobiales bacterium]|nr:SRPBCC domain-containing protein [Thermomicrobiales bacterium]